MEAPRVFTEIHEIYQKFPPQINHVNHFVEIPLCNRVKELIGYTLVNLEDANYLLKYSYSLQKAANSDKKYVISSIGMKLHQLVIGKAPEGYVIDHLNSNSLDNRRENLRFRTYSENAQNRKKKKGTASIYIGVTKSSRNNLKWKASIHKGKTFNLGEYEHEIEAAKVYDVYAVLKFGRYSANNKLLTEEEILYIERTQSPLPGFETGKAERNLPPNISTTPQGSYRYRKMRNRKEYAKTTGPFLEDCIAHKAFMEKKWAEEDRLAEIQRASKPLIIGGYYVIPVTRGDQKIAFVVDEHVWPDVSRFSWCLNPNGYATSKINNKYWLLHRYVYHHYVEEIPEGFELTVDHINSNLPYDTRISQLRLASKALQSHNKKRNKKNLDRYKGVYFDGHSFRVIIGKDYHGAFETEEEAAVKANEIFIELYGENACLNVVDLSNKTTKHNRLPDEKLNRKYISTITHKKEIELVVMRLGLNIRAGGHVAIDKIKSEEVIPLREMILERYFPLQHYNEQEDKSMDDIIENEINWIIIPPEILIQHELKINPPQEISKPLKASITFQEIENFRTLDQLRAFIKPRKLNTQANGIYELWPKGNQTNYSLSEKTKISIRNQLLFIFFPDLFLQNYEINNEILAASYDVVNLLQRNTTIREANPEINLARLIEIMNHYLKN